MIQTGNMTNILQLDHSGFYRRTLQQLFTAEGFNYFGARDEDEAWKIIAEYPVHLVLTAMEIGTDGAAGFIERLGSDPKTKNLPVFVITGSDTLDERKAMFRLGVVDYITKDTKPEEIVQYLLHFTQQDQLLKTLCETPIAVVDDSEFELKVIRALFDLYGVKKADYFKDVMSLESSGKEYAIYLVDVVLKETTGEKLVVTLRNRSQHSMIIGMSSVDNYRTIANILSAGADDYLTKPFNREVFIARLKSNLRTWLLVKELDEKNRELERLVGKR
jgi:DNA-binding response OmpR family regulator